MVKPSFARLRQAFCGSPPLSQHERALHLAGRCGGTQHPRRRLRAGREQLRQPDERGLQPWRCADRRGAGAAEEDAGYGGRLADHLVAVFRRYLLATLGAPAIGNASPFDDSFRGKRGVIAFSVDWRDATGHIAPWNGAACREPDHDNCATYVNPVEAARRTYRGEVRELP